jgi:hypothetical protein
MQQTTFFLEASDGTRYSINKATVIGRVAPEGLQLADPEVSRNHATVWPEGDGLSLRDLGSANGTFVNGARISAPTRLANGDSIRVGNTLFQVRLEAEGFLSAAAQASSSPAPRPAPAKRRSIWLAAGGAAAVLGCLCIAALVVVGLVAWLRARGGLSSQTEGTGALERFAFATVTTVSVPADGGFAQDEQGVGASIGEGVLDPGATGALTSAELDPELSDQIDRDFEILSLAYSVVAAGDSDGKGQAVLRFPAASPEARLAVVIDDTYLGLLELEPQEGYLTIQTHVAAQSGATDWGPADGGGSPRRYLVVVPRNPSAEARGDPVSVAASTGPVGGAVFSLASVHARQAAPLRRCDLIGVTICLTDGSVYFYHKDPLADEAVLAGAATAVQTIMSQYAGMGIAAARISPSNPIHIVLGAYKNPSYSALTGNLYMDWTNIQTLADPASGSQANLSHEIAHWLQDCTYVMTSASFSQLARWWMEVSAENLSFLQNPASLGSNLASYGRLQEAGDVRYGLQLAPFIWTGETDARYIQAIPVHVGMCDDPSVCLFSQDQFIQAINTGMNPFAAGGMSSTYYLQLQDTARYLLGYPPAYANSGILIPDALRIGNLANEWVAVGEGAAGSGFDTHLDSQAPQVQKSADEVTINAAMDRGGLYSFRVANSGRALGLETPLRPGLPAYLEIQGGAPYLFTVDNGEPQAEDGSRTAYIAPVHDSMGWKLVRAVAYAEDAPRTFQAKVGYVDLTGEWITENFAVTNSSSECGEDTLSDMKEMTEDLFLKILSAYGHFETDGAPSDTLPYKWVQDQPFPEDMGSLTVDASAQATTQDVRVEYSFVIPEPPEGTSWLPWQGARGAGKTTRPAGVLASLSVGILGLVAFSHKPRRAKVLLALVIVSLLPQLAACDLKFDIWGDITGQYTFRRLSYLPEDYAPITDQKDLWRLTEGEGEMVFDLTFRTGVGESTEESACVLTNTIKTDLLIQADGSVTPEDLNLEG